MTVPDANAGRGPGTAPGAGKPAGGDSASPGAAEVKPGAETDPGASEAKPGAQAQPGAEATAAAGEAKADAGGAKADAAQVKAAAGEAKPGAGEAKQAAAGAGAAAEEEDHLTAEERAELQRLRAEVAELHEHPPGQTGSGRRSHLGWRAPVATVLIVVGCLLAPLSVFAVWTANQVSNTDRYVANVEPLIHDPSVQRALTDKITAEIDARLNVKGLTEQAAGALTQRGLTRVGSLLNNFSGQLASAVYGFIHTQVAKIVASPQVANLWVQVNRQVHAQLVKALSGQSNGAVTISNNQVVLNLGPFINVVKRDLANRGLTIVTRIPKINPTLALFSAKYLVKAQAGVPAAERPQVGAADPHPGAAGPRGVHGPQPPAGADRRRARPGRVHGDPGPGPDDIPRHLSQQRAVQRAARRRGRGPVRHADQVHPGRATGAAGGRADRRDRRVLLRPLGHRRPHPRRVQVRI